MSNENNILFRPWTCPRFERAIATSRYNALPSSLDISYVFLRPVFLMFLLPRSMEYFENVPLYTPLID